MSAANPRRRRGLEMSAVNPGGGGGWKCQQSTQEVEGFGNVSKQPRRRWRGFGNISSQPRRRRGLEMSAANPGGGGLEMSAYKPGVVGGLEISAVNPGVGWGLKMSGANPGGGGLEMQRKFQTCWRRGRGLGFK